MGKRPMDKASLTIAEAAELIGVSDKTVRRLIRRGDMAAKRLDTSSGFVYAIRREDAEAERDRRSMTSGPTDYRGIISLGKMETALDELGIKLADHQAESLRGVQAKVQAGFGEIKRQIGEVQQLQQELAKAQARAAELETALALERSRSWWQRIIGRGG